jgi:hypothetical protein
MVTVLQDRHILIRDSVGKKITDVSRYFSWIIKNECGSRIKNISRDTYTAQKSYLFLNSDMTNDILTISKSESESDNIVAPAIIFFFMQACACRQLREAIAELIIPVLFIDKMEPLFVGGRHVCQVCGDSQATKFDARERYQLKHRENRRPHICEVCGSTFGTLSQYKTHMMRKKLHYDRQDPT